MQQRTPEWFEARLGKWTGSRVADATATLRGGTWGASRERYMGELIAETLTRIPAKSCFITEDMQWGIDHEDAGKSIYAARTFCVVQDVGFIVHPHIGGAGASPDGLVDDDGQIELKCPITATHIDTLLGAKISERYIKQVQWGLAVTGRQWCDWVSYDPRMPPHMQLYVERVPRDDAMIANLERMCVEFLREMAARIAALEAKYGQAAA